MGSIAAWLGALAWPLVSRVILAMGLGTVTYLGLSAAVNGALSAAKGVLGGLSADVAGLLALAGFFEALSIGAGAIVASIAFSVAKKFTLRAVG